ncbi:MAG: hypothetical protein ACYC06_11395 [Ilumatobacteraceae bacterium]
MSNDISTNAASTATELAALADTIERCCQRIGSLASSRVMVVRHESNPDVGDDMLSAIYEAERGLKNAHRLVVRAARLGR